MSRSQPTLQEATNHVASILRLVETAKEVRPAHAEPMGPEGFWIRHKYARGWCVVRWPMSSVENRCDTCGCALQVRRDAGSGFWYDGRWLTGNPAQRDPRCGVAYDPRYACLSCFNRIRPALRKAQQINENRLMIGRIQREARHAAA